MPKQNTNNPQEALSVLVIDEGYARTALILDWDLSIQFDFYSDLKGKIEETISAAQSIYASEGMVWTEHRKRSPEQYWDMYSKGKPISELMNDAAEKLIRNSGLNLEAKMVEKKEERQLAHAG